MNIRTGQQRQFNTLDVRLKQLEAARVQQPSVTGSSLMSTDNGMSSSELSMPAPKICLSLAAQLAAANPAWQNQKLIGQALSAAPPVLKLFHPKNALAIAEEE